MMMICVCTFGWDSYAFNNNRIVCHREKNYDFGLLLCILLWLQCFCFRVVVNNAEKSALNRMQLITFCVISWEWKHFFFDFSFNLYLNCWNFVPNIPSEIVTQGNDLCWKSTMLEISIRSGLTLWKLQRAVDVWCSHGCKISLAFNQNYELEWSAVLVLFYRISNHVTFRTSFKF